MASTLMHFDIHFFFILQVIDLKLDSKNICSLIKIVTAICLAFRYFVIALLLPHPTTLDWCSLD